MRTASLLSQHQELRGIILHGVITVEGKTYGQCTAVVMYTHCLCTSGSFAAITARKDSFNSSRP